MFNQSDIVIVVGVKEGLSSIQVALGVHLIQGSANEKYDFLTMHRYDMKHTHKGIVTLSVGQHRRRLRTT